MKRTVFADLGSNLKVQQPAKDDSTVTGQTDNPKEVLKPLDTIKEKPSALLRPAQRPLQVSSTKVNQALSLPQINEAPINDNPETEQKLPEKPVETRKAVIKRATTVFKEPSLPAAEEKLPSISQLQLPAPATTALTHKPLPTRKLDILPVIALSQPLRDTVVQVAEPKPSLLRGLSMPGVRTQSAPIVVPQPVVREVKEPSLYSSAVLPSIVAAKELPVVDELNRSTYVDALELQAIALEQEGPRKPTRESQTSYSEPEEYWEEEDEEEYFDAEGYTTARSLRSRGDNTTGCLTMVNMPKVTAKVEKELAAAKLYVDSTRTIEDIEDESWDTSMVAEYGEEIFEYMRGLEVGHVHALQGTLMSSELIIVVGANEAQSPLHGQPTRNTVVDAICADGLACTSTPSLQPLARDALLSHQLRRPLSFQQDCVARKAAACRRHCYVYRRQIRRDQLSFCSRDCLHGRWRIHCGRDPEGRAIHAEHAPV